MLVINLIYIYLRNWVKLFLLFTFFSESIPRQVDKKSRVPEEEKGVWGSQGGDKGLEFSRRRKGQRFFPTFLSKDYITIMYPA